MTAVVGIARFDFEEAWPEVERRVLSGLRARGIDHDVAEEAVQEAAARALRARPVVDSVDELSRWVFTVALRVVVDRSRRRLTTVSLDAIGAAATSDASTPVADDAGADVERSAIARLDLARVTRALRGLRALDQASLLSAAGVVDAAAPADRAEAVRDAVRLHRARGRLLDAVGRIAAILSFPIRKLWRAVATGGWTAPTAAAAAIVAGLMSALPFVSDDEPPAPPRPTVVETPAPAAAVAPPVSAPAPPAARAVSPSQPHAAPPAPPDTAPPTTAAPEPPKSTAINRRIPQMYDEISDDVEEEYELPRVMVGGLALNLAPPL
ncbi:MAG TPA: sigma factor [Acidimicrobiales bacterium]